MKNIAIQIISWVKTSKKIDLKISERQIRLFEYTLFLKLDELKLDEKITQND